jgi:hypothetical protein
MAVTTPGAKVQEWNDDWLKTKGNYMTTITPELAQQLLERNVRNRKPKETAIRRYAEDMRNDRWDPDAAALMFAKNGDLIDGQNRLMACQRAGTPFTTMVRTGLHPDTMRHIDLGVRRNVTDTFKIEQVKFATSAAGSIAMRLRYEEAEANGRKIGQTLDVKGVRMSPDEALAFLKDHPMHSSAGLAAYNLYRMAPRIKQSTWLCFLAMAGERDEVGAKEFAERLLNGELGGQGDPFTAVMRYLTKPRPESRPGHRLRNVQERDLLALVKAWNAWKMEQPIASVDVGDNDPLEPLV